ncbi:MAG TPA: site-2 protease family protein [Pyrinomonadaceae bacterium]|nr:site-2 protease family protein [Pyrinomonadaceae bacterium]
MPSDIVGQLIIYIVVLLLAISAHEAAHAWMSHKFGDDTAYLLGRVTLNPVKHTDPIGTLLIPIVGFIYGAMGGAHAGLLIGWGKPTPVNPLRWRNKDLANVMVSIAGILANTSIALGALVIIKVLQATGQFGKGATVGHLMRGAMSPNFSEPVAMILLMMLFLNASLAVFNLLPFPPLDGSKILYSILPSSAEPMLDFLERYGFWILIIAMYFGFFGVIFAPVDFMISQLLIL